MSGTTFEKFRMLAKEGVIVPMYTELLADLETPVSVLQRFCDDDNVFLLESVEGGEHVGRYSFLGIHPRGIFRAEHDAAFYDNRPIRFNRTPMDALRNLISAKSVAHDPDLPPLPGSAVGYVGYEAVRAFESLPKIPSDSGLPDALLMVTDEIIGFDNVRHTLKIILCIHTDEFPDLPSAFAHGKSRIAAISERLKKPAPAVSPARQCTQPPVKFTPGSSQTEYCRMVEKARDYIKDGEIIQAVLSQKFTAPLASTPLAIYRALRLINPSPYTFYLKLGGLILIGSSPETLVKLDRRCSSVRPIAGTRKRGKTDAEDRALADELLKDEKECAEHLMLVDLGRNDLGRTAAPGSVQVKSFLCVERYSHVMHLVSDVEGILRDNCDAIDLLRTTFPAGTLSGAPKLRAMEIIQELEHAPRGVYGGSVGYFSYDGNMDMAITIRTVQIQNDTITLQVGAGIVADSVPEAEYQETMNKAGALFAAVDLANRNLEEI
ncbi:MAG: anthranilate synthase component I [Victivallaceae bacterium]|nr:anthranilate synthase component I [Victivallaceae bacterium]